MITKLIKVSTSSCCQCKHLSDELKDFSIVPIEEIDAEEDDTFCEKNKIRSVPVLFFMSDDNIIFRHNGFMTKDNIEQKINELNNENS